jgi:hypothetical protein
MMTHGGRVALGFQVGDAALPSQPRRCKGNRHGELDGPPSAIPSPYASEAIRIRRADIGGVRVPIDTIT